MTDETALAMAEARFNGAVQRGEGYLAHPDDLRVVMEELARLRQEPETFVFEKLHSFAINIVEAGHKVNHPSIEGIHLEVDGASVVQLGGSIFMTKETWQGFVERMPRHRFPLEPSRMAAILKEVQPCTGLQEIAFISPGKLVECLVDLTVGEVRKLRGIPDA